ncbi:MAG: DUF4149 domain-containing protein [Pseudomonadota bacterium]
MHVFETIGIYAVALLLGGMVFFPSVVAPTVFKSLSAEDAGAFLRRLFPTYYVFIIATSLLGAAALFSRPALAITLALIAASTLAVRQILVPKINAWRDQELAGDAAAKRHFALGHRASVIINFAQMVAAVWALWVLST